MADNTASADLAQVNSGVQSDLDINKDDLILGIIGEGTLIVFIFIILALIICFFREMTQCANLCVVLAAALPVIVLLILLDLPKESLQAKTDTAPAPEDAYLLSAWFFMSFLLITLCCALSCLCKVQFRPAEVRRIDSEIGVHKYDEEGFSGLVIGGEQDRKDEEEARRDENQRRDAPAARSGAGSGAGSAAASPRNSDGGNQQLLQRSPRASGAQDNQPEGGSALSMGSQLSYAWPEPEKVPRRARLARQSADDAPEMLFTDKVERRNQRYHDDLGEDEELERLSYGGPVRAPLVVNQRELQLRNRRSQRKNEFSDLQF